SPKVKTAYQNIETFDAAVFLTNQQKCDIQNRVGVHSNFHVIPHFHDDTLFSVKSLKPRIKDTKTAIVISRLSTLKRIDHVIKAFKIVAKNIPNTRLEVWGIGDEETNLRELISDLNLEKSVFL